MQSTNGSEVRYLESEKAYSFQSCPNRSCAGPIRVWLNAKYPDHLNIRRQTCRAKSYLRRRNGCNQLPRLLAPFSQPPRGWNLLKTNHKMMALSVLGRPGCTRVTMASVVPNITANPPKNTTRRTGTDHWLARYPATFASMG